MKYSSIISYLERDKIGDLMIITMIYSVRCCHLEGNPGDDNLRMPLSFPHSCEESITYHIISHNNTLHHIK